MVQPHIDVIDLCDSDDDVPPNGNRRSGRDADDAISLSSDDEDPIVVPRPGGQEESIVAPSRAEVSQVDAISNNLRPNSNAVANIEPAAARNNERAQNENPVAHEETMRQEFSLRQEHAAVQRETTLAQAYASATRYFLQSSGGRGVDTIIDQGNASPNGSIRLPLHVPDTATRHIAAIPSTNRRENMSVRAPNVQDCQNQIKTEVKAEGDPQLPHARSTARSQPTSSVEGESIPDRNANMESDIGSPIRHRKKIIARKTAARRSDFDSADSEESNGEFLRLLLARRMREKYGGNQEDDNEDDSSDDDSDISSYNSISKTESSSTNADDGPTGIIQIPRRSNNQAPQRKGVSEDVSDISSVEDRAKGGIEKNDYDECDSTGSLEEGPVEPTQRPIRRRILLEDEESIGSDQVTPTGYGRSVSESDNSDLSELIIDKDFQGGKDKPISNLRKTEKLDAIASSLHPMEKIDHLCSLELNKETSLPTYKFSVHNKDDTIIYDFHVRVDKSKIPNAGRGAFLQFVGARELKPSRKACGDSQKKSGVRRLPEPLPAIYPHGMGVTVTLKGENFPEPPTKIRIGSKRIYTESDYVAAPHRTFSSLHPNCGPIELGQYGPFRLEDRKTQDLFDIKSFLFSNVPSEWAFDEPREEESDEGNHMIDITDEVTGDTHEAACRHIPMYVNEVGHDENLEQTVSALDGYKRNVLYFIVIREPMSPGDTIELLVAYEGFYEEVRMRKGYGEMNIKNEAKSDDHLGSFLEREFVTMDFMENLIRDFKPDDICKMMSWLLSTHSSLSNIVNSFLKEAKAIEQKEGARKIVGSTPLSQQIVALRRFEWIANLFEQNLRRQKKKAHDITTINNLLLGISNLKWSKWKELIVVLSRLRDVKDVNGKSLYGAFEREIVSELCYNMGDHRIKSPMVEGLWCSLAMSLTRELCIATAKEIWERENDKDSLMRVYVQLASDAVKSIMTCRNLESLCFVPNFKGGYTGLPEDEMQKLKSIRASGEGKIGEVLSLIQQSDNIKPLGTDKHITAIPRPWGVDLTVQVNRSWYICWQVLYLVESFAQAYLKGSTYTLTGICDQIGIGTDTRGIMEAAIVKRIEARKCQAKKRKNLLSSPCKRERKRRKMSASPGGFSARQKFFWFVTWKCLEELGWRREHGNRPGDFYAFPPGVTRKNGSNRTHFFDSVKQIKEKITQDERWKENPTLKSALIEEEKCCLLYTKLKGSKSLPNFDSNEAMIEWLRSQAKNNGNK